MKKVSFKVNGQNVVGILHNPKGKEGVLLVHGFKGDKDEHGRFVEVAGGLEAAGFCVLRIDCRGSGESEGSFSEMNILTEVEDVLGAIGFMKKSGIKKIGLLGQSMGGEVSILAALQADVDTLVLTAPVTSSERWKSYLTTKQKTELEGTGKITILSKSTGREFVVGKKFFDVAWNLKVEDRLKDLGIPVFIIHGGKDFGIPAASSKEAYAKIRSEKKLRIIKGAGHDFTGYLDEVIRLSADWFSKHLR